MREVVPLSGRKIDILILAFFWLNILFITYLFDIEQVLVTDTSLSGTDAFEYPVWPPKAVVDVSHNFGRNHDPLLMARPMFWRMTIWIDQLFFGPFYIVAIFAFTKGKDWIRIPSIIYASVMLTNVTIIMGEEMNGVWASPDPAGVIGANAAWMIIPAIVIVRMWRGGEHPFTKASGE